MKKIFATSVMSLIAASSSALAVDHVSITNDTNQVISLAAMQVGICARGIPPHQTGTVRGENIKILCNRYEHDCIGDMFASDDCTGLPVARIHVDVENGVYQIDNYGPFDITHTADHIIFKNK